MVWYLWRMYKPMVRTQSEATNCHDSIFTMWYYPLRLSALSAYYHIIFFFSSLIERYTLNNKQVIALRLFLSQVFVKSTVCRFSVVLADLLVSKHVTWSSHKTEVQNGFKRSATYLTNGDGLFPEQMIIVSFNSYKCVKPVKPQHLVLVHLDNVLSDAGPSLERLKLEKHDIGCWLHCYIFTKALR